MLVLEAKIGLSHHKFTAKQHIHQSNQCLSHSLALINLHQIELQVNFLGTRRENSYWYR